MEATGSQYLRLEMTDKVFFPNFIKYNYLILYKLNKLLLD